MRRVMSPPAGLNTKRKVTGTREADGDKQQTAAPQQTEVTKNSNVPVLIVSVAIEINATL